jgi:hypothetical protein
MDGIGPLLMFEIVAGGEMRRKRNEKDNKLEDSK